MQQHFYALRNSFASTFVLLLVFTSTILRGQTLYIGADNGDWLTASNWNAGLPSATNAPTVTGGKIVNINGSLTIDYAVQNFGTIINVGTTTLTTGSISSGGALENRGTLTVNSGGSVTSSGGMLNSGTVNNGGNFNSNSPWTNTATGVLNNTSSFMQLAPITNNGTVANNAGTFTCPQVFTNNKTASNAAGATWKVDFGGDFQNLVGSTLTNAGNFQNLGSFTNNTTVTNTGVFLNNGLHLCAGIFNNENGGRLESTGTFNLSGRINNKLGATLETSFRLNVLANGYVSNLATVTNRDQISIALGGTYLNETGATTTLGFGSKLLNAGYLKLSLNSTISGNGEINNSKKFENFGSVLSSDGGKVINSDSLFNYGLIRNVNILDNSKSWKNAGMIENNNGGLWTNTGSVENMVGGTISNNYEILNKPLATFTNNGILSNNVRFFNEGTFTNNAYLLSIGDFLNRTGATLINNEVIEVREGSIVNEGTLTNNKTIIISNCSVLSNKSAISNTGRIENSGIVFQRGTVTGNAIVALTGWIQTGTSSAANICRASLQAGTDVDGEAKVYGQNPVLQTLGIDECAGFQYFVDNQTRAVYPCSQVGQTFTVPFKLVTRTNDSLTCTIPITIFDGIPPVFDNCPTDVTILTDQNTATYTWPTITAVDFCNGTPTIVSTVASGSAFNLGTTEVVVTARDASNNAGDCRFRVTVQKVVAVGTCSATDVTAPVFTGCPANITVAAQNGGRIVTWTPPSVSDACLPITLTSDAQPGQFVPAGTKTVTYRAKDSKGNIGTCSFTITVTGSADPCLTDAVKPVITNCPSNVFATTNTTINGAVAIWRAPSASDNCGFVSLTSNFNSGATFPAGTTNVIYTATDAKSNTSTCTFTVTVAATNPCAGDVTAPTLTCPATVNVNTTTSSATATWTVPTPTDACAGGVTLNATHTPGSTFGLDTTRVTYTAADKVGNRSTCTFSVIVKNACFSDTTRPLIAGCPADIVRIQTGGSATATWTAPTATDNCGSVGVFSNYASGSAFPIGTTQVLYTAIDDRGNQASCTFNVTVQVSGVATCTGNVLLNSSFENNFTEWFTTDVTTVSITNDAVSGANAASICGNNKPVLSKLVSLLGGTYTATAQAKVTGAPTSAFVGIEFYDAAGVVIPTLRITRAVTAITYGAITFTFTKPATASNFAFIANKTGTTGCLLVDDVCITNPCTNDVTPPVFTGCPANITVNGTGTATTGIATWTAPVATDNCSTPAVVSNFNSGQSFPLGATTVTYTATDLRNLTATCSFTVTYVNPCATDAVIPSFGTTCPASQTLTSANGACVTTTWVAPTATDNCSTPSVTSTHATTFCFPVGTTAVTYTATDARNNKATCTFNVVVNNACATETTPPTFTYCPPAQTKVTATTTGVVSWTNPSATDFCSTPTVSAPVTSPTVGLTNGGNFPIGNTTVTYTATDARGNKATCSFVITVTQDVCLGDVTAPSFGTTCPTNRTGVSTNGLCVAVNFTAPTATDNCGTPSVSGTHANNFCFPIGVTTVTYTAADSKNNKATCTFTVTITGGSTGGDCAASSATGGITREFFQLTSTTFVSPVVVPTTAPTTTTTLTSFVAPQNVADNYIQRVRGFLRPTVSGNYTFYLTGDDNSDLYISTSTNPANKTRIAFINGWTLNDELTKYPSQKSVAVALVAGQNYYIEAVQQEGGGGDNLAIYWQVPTSTTAQNLAVNGDFSAGNTGFTSDFQLTTTGQGCGTGYYVLGPNKGSYSWATECNPLSNGSGGNKMYVDNAGDGMPNKKIWGQTVAVAPNSSYSFRVSAASIYAGNPARLFLQVNGVTISPVVTLQTATCQWTTFAAAWNSGTATSAHIAIVNQNGDCGGNDFVIDDIAFTGSAPIASSTPVIIPGANLVPFCINVVDPCVAAPSVGGSISPASQAICISATQNPTGIATTRHTLAGNVGTIVRWEYCAPNSTTWVNWGGGGSATAPSNCCFSSVGTWKVRAITKNGTCAEVASSIGHVVVTACTTPPVSPCSGGLQASYFNNSTLSGTPVLSRIDQTINFDWGVGSPAPSVNVDNFSVRWTGQIFIPTTGTYTFTGTTDDGYRLWVNGVLLIDRWFDQAPTTYTATANLTAGQSYDLRIEYYENGGGAVAKAAWSYAGVATQPIPAANLCSNPCSIAGSINREVFWNQTDAAFPIVFPTTSPNLVTQQGNLEGPQNIGDNYKTRASGFIKPQVSGNYTFNITGNDNTEFYLSTNDAKANLTQRAFIQGWTNIDEETKYTSQTSTTINLTAGKLYYFELRHREGVNNDHWRIRWKTPANEAAFQIVNSQFLARPCTTPVQAATSANVFTFMAKADVNQAQLQWVSNGGLRNDYYEVERANELGEFEKLGTVNANTGKSEPESFSFTDANPLDGENAYRIKTIENGGTIRFSNIETVNFGKNTEGVRLFPNPANDYVDIDLKKYRDLQVTVSVYNQFGKLMQTAQIEKASSAPFHLELGDVASGSYLIRIQAQGKREVMRKLQIAK